MARAPENSFPMCMCYYPESGGCHRYAVVNQKYCVDCLGEETNWACQCKCDGCPRSHAAAVATKVEALPCAVSSRGQPDGAVADEKDSDMSAQERLDRRNTAWWLERKANDQAREQARLEQMRKDDMEVAAYWEARKEKEHADIMANLNEWAMEIVVAALGLRPGSTSDFAISAVSVVQPAPFSTFQQVTSAVSVVQPAPFSKVASPDADADQDADADADADAVADADADTDADVDAVSFEAVLEEVEGAHCLIALFLGPDDGLDGDMQFPEVYRLRRTSRRVRQISYYDVHWLRAWSWLCGCKGDFERGAGCAMEWRQQAWICPVIFRFL